METTAVKRQVAAKQGMQAFDIVLVGVLLAVGMVLRMYMPPVGPITPNLVIGMYCLAIILVRPRIIETLVIGIVAAALCQLTSKSAIPYLNFISEPVGVLVALALVKAPFNLSIKKYSFKPALVTLLGTIASGLVYVLSVKAVLLFRGTAGGKAFIAMLLVVITTAIANTVIVQLIYYPIKAALGKKE